jgi:gluconolactonase
MYTRLLWSEDDYSDILAETAMHVKTALFVSAALLAPALVIAQAGQTAAPRLPAGATTAPPLSVQGPADPGYAELIKVCKTPPPARGRGAGGAPRAGGPGGAPAPGGGAPGGAGGAARGPAAPQGVREYTVTEIPGVIAAGQRWTFHWQEAGNNGDGVLGTDDGGLLIAQNDNSRVVKLDRNGNTSVVYTDTRTGGALSMNASGALFINERGLRARIEQLTPQRRVLADSFQGEPLDCIGGVLNDLTADRRGGAYFTMGGLFYANPQGVVTRYGEGLTTNGIVLSADEKILYVTNGPTIAAFDVQPDGALTNQREFGKLGSGGDGLAIDSAGRLYVTTAPGVQVLAPDGASLGVIPTPRGVISGAFSGPDKQRFYILARGAQDADGNEVANAAQVYSIQMIARGFRGRAK